MCEAARGGGAAKCGVGRGGGEAICGVGCGAMAGRCGMAGGWNAGAAGRAMAGGAAGRAAGAAAGPGGPPLPWPWPGPWADAPTLAARIETLTKKAVRQTPRGSMIVAPSNRPQLSTPRWRNRSLSAAAGVAIFRRRQPQEKSCVRVVANRSSAQSTWSLVITSGGAIRIVCSWVSLARMPLAWSASQ
jgi:hypothetical protein